MHHMTTHNKNKVGHTHMNTHTHNTTTYTHEIINEIIMRKYRKTTYTTNTMPNTHSNYIL